jgi:FkbM family methyltransferase
MAATVFAGWRGLFRLFGRGRRRNVSAYRRRIFVDGGGHDGCSVRKWLHMHAGFKTVSFEPNPALAGCFEDINGTLIQAAIWIDDREISFFLDEHDADGSSVFREQSGMTAGRELVVPAIDFSRWLAENISGDDYCVLKLDIEGAEYPVLEALVERGTICLVDELYVEFHQKWLQQRISRERHDALVRRLRELGLPPRNWNALQKRYRSPRRP